MPGRILIYPWISMNCPLANSSGQMGEVVMPPPSKKGAQKMLCFKCPSNHASFADIIYLKVSTRHATYIIHNDVHT